MQLAAAAEQKASVRQLTEVFPAVIGVVDFVDNGLAQRLSDDDLSTYRLDLILQM